MPPSTRRPPSTGSRCRRAAPGAGPPQPPSRPARRGTPGAGSPAPAGRNPAREGRASWPARAWRAARRPSPAGSSSAGACTNAKAYLTKALPVARASAALLGVRRQERLVGLHREGQRVAHQLGIVLAGEHVAPPAAGENMPATARTARLVQEVTRSRDKASKSAAHG